VENLRTKLVPERVEGEASAARSRPFAREQRTEELLCLVRVVRATAKKQIVDSRLSTCGERDHVVELQETAFSATSPSSHEGALSRVAFPDGPSDGSGNVSARRHP
jgi:hypothetical protein